MRILCSNDDGVRAHGLDCLVRAASGLGEVSVVAPDREQSAASHALTLHHPVRPVQLEERRWQVDGTPTDCVMLAIEALMPERPDWVFSGINHGQNMGEDVLYSGTVAAAMEGLALGVPSIAVSFAGGNMRSNAEQLERQVEPLARLLHHLTRLAVPQTTLFNINLPPVEAGQIRGVRLTRLGQRIFSDSIKSMQDPWGRPIFWIGGGTVTWTGAEDSDFRAIQDGYISVTPLSLNLTHGALLDCAPSWWEAP